MSSTLFSHQTNPTAARSADTSETDENPAGQAAVLPDAEGLAGPNDAGEAAMLEEPYPAERPATGYPAALDAAVELALAGEHVHLVGSGESECVSLHCEPEPIGGLTL